MIKRKLKRPKAVRKPKKPKLPSISKLIKSCDKEFSIQVRQKLNALHENGARPHPVNPETGLLIKNYCFTCLNLFEVKKLHCGHFLSRYYKAARWDFDNCRPQCYMCNIHRRGDPVRFRQNLIKEIGIKRVEAVEAKRDQSIKLSRQYLTDLLTSLTT